MIVRFLQILTEYFAMILCVHKVSKKQIEFSWHSLLDFFLWVTLIIVGENIRFGKLILYIYLFTYVKVRITQNWKKAIRPFVVTMCAIPMLQLVIYSIISIKMMQIFNIYLVGTIINVLMIIIFAIWRQEYLFILTNIVSKFRKIIFLILLSLLFKYIISYYSEYKVIESYFIDQIVICFLLITLMFILWINSENEKRHKAEELRTYQLYTKTFEDAVVTIRTKQHEFDNHINAIKCMQYTIHNTEELINEQNKYYERILQDNKYNKLLKLNTSPILIGYLYSKFTAASARGVNIEYEIQDINIEHVVINDLIEIIGILFDNAVEALEQQEKKEMEVRILKTNNNFALSIANISDWKTNSEIEKFFEYGYSTKGKEHGIGLYRINMILKKYKACIQVENIVKNDINYLCFKIVL